MLRRWVLHTLTGALLMRLAGREQRSHCSDCEDHPSCYAGSVSDSQDTHTAQIMPYHQVNRAGLSTMDLHTKGRCTTNRAIQERHQQEQGTERHWNVFTLRCSSGRGALSNLSSFYLLPFSLQQDFFPLQLFFSL